MSATTTTKLPCKSCPTPKECKAAGVCLNRLKKSI